MAVIDVDVFCGSEKNWIINRFHLDWVDKLYYVEFSIDDVMQNMVGSVVMLAFVWDVASDLITLHR